MRERERWSELCDACECNTEKERLREDAVFLSNAVHVCLCLSVCLCVCVCTSSSGFALPLISYQVKESWGVKTEHMPKASQMFKGAGKAD